VRRPSNALRDAASEAGLRAVLIVPLLGGERPTPGAAATTPRLALVSIKKGLDEEPQHRGPQLPDTYSE